MLIVGKHRTTEDQDQVGCKKAYAYCTAGIDQIERYWKYPSTNVLYISLNQLCILCITDFILSRKHNQIRASLYKRHWPNYPENNL